tara:strand:+ start:107 stop:250 length:144 start_codon:yes stop_codon:yes gene_type:complete
LVLSANIIIQKMQQTEFKLKERPKNNPTAEFNTHKPVFFNIYISQDK